ncbi:MAG TPA: ABC transporter substrate-binding protein, partial [Microbacterium sp.]|uniref:ABC transporter substrate-binding protein n=1 Tax=Microbacterium sp. TaxID=51671 RepID=UPI002B4931D0
MHITRTSMLTAAAVGITAALALSACSGTVKNTSTTSVPSSELVTDTPRGSAAVDSVTWNVFEGEPQTIDPYHGADYTPNMINSNMCETLLVQTPDFTIRPNLATRVSNPDPLTWVYDIRTGVRFWDGSPMTAEDVAWSLQHGIDDKTSFYGYILANVKTISVTGANQVTIKLAKPDYLFNDELATYAGVVVEKKFSQEHGAAVGTPGVGV